MMFVLKEKKEQDDKLDEKQLRKNETVDKPQGTEDPKQLLKRDDKLACKDGKCYTYRYRVMEHR